MPIAAGRLRQRVRIEEPNAVDNGIGGRAVPAGLPKRRIVADRVPAEVIPLRGTVATEHLVTTSKQLWRVTIRNRPGMTIQRRIVWGSIDMQIKSVAPNETGDGLVMTCESGGRG